MNRAEIMNCAAILAAGLLTNEANAIPAAPELAVDLMEQIAQEISKKEMGRQQEISKKWI